MKAVWGVFLILGLVGVVAAASGTKSFDLRYHFEEIAYKGNYEPFMAHVKGLPYLSHWLLVVAFMSLFGTLQAFASTALLKQYQFDKAQQEVTPLAGKLFGAWTLIATLVRISAALEPWNASLYRLAVATFVVALGIYMHAFIIARSISFSNVMKPMVFAVPSFVWMVFFPPQF
jgi:hypothetical protein